MMKNNIIKSVLIIGSGPIIIGQACEFDYSGSQAAMALKEEGIEVSIINSNPATIMTDKIIVDNVYLKPLEIQSIIDILIDHINNRKPINAVLPTMGGQTALNLCIEAEKLGLWKKYNVEIIGLDHNVIDITENREKFKNLMIDIGINVPISHKITSLEEGNKIAKKIGFPLVIRSSYTLGGRGGGIVYSKKDLNNAVENGLKASPLNEIIMEKSLYGWKEFELELLKDKKGNTIIVCPIENFDPTGIHTGDSITVAPTMTLPDKIYQKIRDMAIKMTKNIGYFTGGCNVQFAINPINNDIMVIEINPRVSRSSALASKATGYPIAKIAAKLSIGYNLDELKNQITGNTSAFFEPTIDYVVVKIPKWNFNKFVGCNNILGLQMKSVGEIMAIGRSFKEAFLKACYSIESDILKLNNKKTFTEDNIIYNLKNPSWDRVFYLLQGFKSGMSIDLLYELTKIDKWFLNQLKEIIVLEKILETYNIDNIPIKIIKEYKEYGFSDYHMSVILKSTEEQVLHLREKNNIKRIYHMVDTCAGEFNAYTPYYYSSYNEENESISNNTNKIIIIGSGPNRIGQGIEFDYSCVHGILSIKKCGYEAIMINCNPETVSTDFNIADKLYFEPLSWEYIYDIIKLENPLGVIVQLGGQTSIKIAEKLKKNNIKIYGTSYDNIHLAEDRGKFSEFLINLGIPYPKYGISDNVNQALTIGNKIGYPLLIRPSYVLGGQDMHIVYNNVELTNKITKIFDKTNNNVIIDHFLENAKEVESDAICDGKNVIIIGIMEHIENAGIHSGDSTSVLPTFSLSNDIINQIKKYTILIAQKLEIIGFINIQFAIKNDTVYVIEANPRVSRTVPFISKAYNISFVDIATKIIIGHEKLDNININTNMQGYAIKEPIFSFDRFPDADIKLGPEMKSTGENIRFVKTSKEIYKLYNLN
ncbi:MAG: carbamoyl-phosphate synthase large subunit [Bacteroides sp.]|nr:MAG: carbamoyl-phosphate synthase large subunit [Bacteroides sp.]